MALVKANLLALLKEKGLALETELLLALLKEQELRHTVLHWERN
jgi:hypothetical protein